MDIETPPDSPSALLERAAERLEALAAGTTPGAWQARDLPDEPGYANVLVESAQSFGGFSSLFSSSCCGGHCYGHVERRGDAEWIAALSPAVAQPLVEWLRYASDRCAFAEQRVAEGRFRDVNTVISSGDHAALAFARQVLGES